MSKSSETFTGKAATQSLSSNLFVLTWFKNCYVVSRTLEKPYWIVFFSNFVANLSIHTFYYIHKLWENLFYVALVGCFVRNVKTNKNVFYNYIYMLLFIYLYSYVGITP